MHHTMTLTAAEGRTFHFTDPSGVRHLPLSLPGVSGVSEIISDHDEGKDQKYIVP